jgi:hydroxymethylpyrimidine pyrophosphatase-like HAD family hydrolase
VQRYFAETSLRGVATSPGGPLCALDVDGVLESHALGFPAATPAAALALRALLAHGYRPVLATGRSLDEAAERCRVYGLAGAVAEYGSVTFRARDGRVRSLLNDRESAALARLRTTLAQAGDIVVDPDYRAAVRAFTTRGSERVALTPDQTARALTAAGGYVRAIAGEAQTDFVASSAHKGRGLRALAGELGVAGARPYALAVGDTRSDLPFAGVAVAACAPAHADPALARAGFAVMRRPYQAGLAEAVGRLVGHAPGGCARCRPPAQSSERALLLRMLGAAERGRIGLLTTALELWWRAR